MVTCCMGQTTVIIDAAKPIRGDQMEASFCCWEAIRA
jgi:hypothetical protein